MRAVVHEGHASRRAALVLGLASILLLPACREDRGAGAISLMEDMALVFELNKTSCDSLGQALEQFVSENRERFDKLAEYEKTRTEEERQAFRDKYGARADAAMAKIMVPEVARCAKNAKVKAALSKIGESAEAAAGDD